MQHQKKKSWLWLKILLSLLVWCFMFLAGFNYRVSNETYSQSAQSLFGKILSGTGETLKEEGREMTKDANKNSRGN